jgi:hypothetical protein
VKDYIPSPTYPNLTGTVIIFGILLYLFYDPTLQSNYLLLFPFHLAFSYLLACLVIKVVGVFSKK